MKKARIKFTGDFWEWVGISIAMMFLGMITIGILMPWAWFKIQKYFFDHMEIEFDE